MNDSQIKYVDGFVLVVPKDKVEDYKKMAQEASALWIKYGALSYKECMLEDSHPEWVTLTFPKMTLAKEDDTVWYSYIEYKSKEHRDEVNQKVMKEMDEKNKKKEDKEMSFDMKRMAYGGFEVVVSGE